MRITISGPPGSGKGTVSKILAKHYHLKFYSVGDLRREAARKKGMTIEKFNKWSEKHPEQGDEYFDYLQRSKQNKNDFIMDSRLGWHFIPNSIKIYLDVSFEEGAKRIYLQNEEKNKRNEQKYTTLKETIKANKERVENDVTRYKKLYNINPYNTKNYDILVNSTKLNVKSVVKKLIKEIDKFRKKQKNKSIFC
ncbi:hypothetical protein AUJ10_04140 [Candidatus Pacearchaeota archaeon CG1_02_31_27]|nr:MAG: hypothetical protein AUJ10_04140 [Candidatus Pacearchaeota archaeon CG1_02_31_27]